MTHEGGRPPALSLEAVAAEEAVRALFKAQRAQQLYSANSAARVAALEQARAALLRAWDAADPLVFQVRRDALLFNEEPVLVESSRAGDGLAWLLYREGIREIRLMRGFEQVELEMLLDILGRARTATIDQDDLVTMLWLANMAFFSYRHVEVVLDAGGGRDIDEPVNDEFASQFAMGGGGRSGDREEGGTQGGVRLGGSGGGSGGGVGSGYGDGDDGEGGARRPPLPGAVDEEVPVFLQAMRPQVMPLLDDDQVLVLEPEELAYIEDRMARESGDEHRHNVQTALLEIIQMNVDEPSRLEAVSALDELLLEFLGTAQYPGAAALLTAVDELLARADLAATVFEALGRLADRVSAPGVLRPLLQMLADPRRTPSVEVLERLFADMRPEALPVLAAWLGVAPPSTVRSRLERVALQLAERHPQELATALGTDDPGTLLGVLALATRQPTPLLVPSLCRAARHEDAAVRLAALGLLVGLDGSGVPSTLTEACADASRAARMVAYKAVAARRLSAAHPYLKRVVLERAFEGFDFNERIALFEALGSVADPETVDLLDRLLHARGLLGPKESAEVRACAARALGRVGTATARRALERAADAREPLVQRAVRLALGAEEAL